VLLVPAYAVVVAAPAGPDQGCPSPRQTTDALMAHIPAVVVSGDEASTPGVLRLNVSGGAPLGPLRVELTDQGGEARLYRNLSIAERGRGNDCVALADTVALIVERFLHDLGYEVPPSPPPAAKEMPRANLSRGPPAPPIGPNRVDLVAGGSWRGASPMEDSDFEVGVGLGFERGLAGHRIAASFSGGVSSARSSDPFVMDPTAHANMRRVSARIGLAIPMVAGPGWFEPGVRLGADWLLISNVWSNPVFNHDDMLISEVAELLLAYRVNLTPRHFARLGVSGGVAHPYNVYPPKSDDPSAQDGPRQRLFGQPRFYVKSGLELGFSFL